MKKTNMAADVFKVLFGKMPGQLVIQVTNYCNADCPQCGMRKNEIIERRKLSTEKIMETVTQCAENGFEAVSFTGGEPFLNMNELFHTLDCVAKTKIPYLRTGTNGYMFAPGGKPVSDEELEKFVVRMSTTKIRNFWISVDSSDTETHETMRGLPGVIEGIMKALPIFHKHGIYPAINLGINRNILGNPIPRISGEFTEDQFYAAFKKGFTAFFEKAIYMGFTISNVCYPMSSDNEELLEEKPAYGAISGDFIVSFSKRELQLVFKSLLEVIPVFRNRLKIFTPLSMLYAMLTGNDDLLFPCLGGIRYFYMDSRDGHIYPCGYRGDQDLGENLKDAIRQVDSQKPHCKKCHWECFRDPSQLFGIARYIFRHPIKVFIKKEMDHTMLKLWAGDLNYYIKCNFFNGRIKPKKKEAATYENAKSLQNGVHNLQKDG